ncbi:hypothetical protein D1872_330010 [compost metagenome]
MNQGAMWCSLGPLASTLPSILPERSRPRTRQMGPSIRTRTSLTTAPVWTASSPAGAAAARTWGTA